MFIILKAVLLRFQIVSTFLRNVCCVNKVIQHIITQLDVIFFATYFISNIRFYCIDIFLGFVNGYVSIFLLVFPFTWIRIDIPRSSNSFYFVCTIKNIKEVIVFVFFLTIRITGHKFIACVINSVAKFL